jgi:hypothetical protein
MPDRAERWLYAQRRLLTREFVERALAGVGALAAAGALTEREAAWWRDELEGGEQPAPEVPEAVRAAAHALLEELSSDERFESALELLAALGAADPAAWDEADEELLDLGGTEADLEAVIPGPPERRRGHRLVLALRFADGMTFLIDSDGAAERDWPLWRLADDRGHRYGPAGSGGGEPVARVRFREPVPAAARWVELSLADDHAVGFRVAL